jgi:RHS repeat-associated protein
MTGYVTGPANRLLSDGVYNYAYDLEGNRTSRTLIATNEVEEFDWDHRQRLVAYRRKDSSGNVVLSAEYVYDAFDRRIAKLVDWDGSGPGVAFERWFVYDGDHIALEWDGDSTVTTRYVHGPQIDQILASEHVGGLYPNVWTLTDHLGSVRSLVDNDGQFVGGQTFDSFGQPVGFGIGITDYYFAYTGREWDTESGLYYYRRRYYDALAGRFLSEDPIGFGGGDANKLRYVGNGVLGATDPSGLQLYAQQQGIGGGQYNFGRYGVSPPGSSIGLPSRFIQEQHRKEGDWRNSSLPMERRTKLYINEGHPLPIPETKYNWREESYEEYMARVGRFRVGAAQLAIEDYDRRNRPPPAQDANAEEDVLVLVRGDSCITPERLGQMQAIIEQAIQVNESPVIPLRPPPNPDGPRGSAATEYLNLQIARAVTSLGWELIGGGGPTSLGGMKEVYKPNQAAASSVPTISIIPSETPRQERCSTLAPTQPRQMA